MCRTQCLFAILAITINLVNSWDIAITTGDQLEFYTNQTKTSNEGIRFRDLTALAYDAVHNMLLFVDKQNDNASIFSYNLLTRKYQPLVGRRSYENIQGLAFDPVTAKMFWTDTNERSIYWISLWPRPKNNIYGNLLIKMDDEIPRDIAVDSCRGYIYWTNTNITKPTIERARFDGSERKIIVDTNIHMPVSIAIDQRTKRLYWADDKEGIHYSIESSDLEGKDRKTRLVGTYHQPNALTVSKDNIYWVDWGFKSVWKLSKNAPLNTEPEELIAFNNEVPFGIVANYQIADQTAGVSDCTILAGLSNNKTLINDAINIPKDVGLFCLHGVKTGISDCKCSPGFTGERCEISVCQNFCFYGDCSLNDKGQPECKCKHGYKGTRCETHVCSQYCLNEGMCSLGINEKLVCKCTNDFVGERCESRKIEPTMAPTIEACNCTRGENATKSIGTSANELYMDENCSSGWDPIRDPILMVLGTLCGLLCLVCAMLITKILYLKRRPSPASNQGTRYDRL
ncbi:protein cueball isoform X2 [Nymphalis io]|uniref:protein cueball isoform X2 n=1 Tax=Inachis io TaxID=171585 RepID=UPI00216A258A|nr:protein cueball isoform X2 [Nymphalis io]